MTAQLIRTTPGAALARLSCGAAVGIGVGVLTLWLQGVLPDTLNLLANSGAVWTVVAVAAAAVFGGSRGISVVAGLLALVGEVAGYYWCAAPWQGISVTQSEQFLWTAAALLLGPIAGLVGQAVARGTANQRVVAWLATAGLIGGEGLYAWHYLPGQHTVAAIEIAIGLLVAVLALFASRAPLGRRAGAAAVGAVVAGVIVFAYATPVLL